MSPVIADLDGNGSLEVVVANRWAVDVLEGRDGTPLTCQSTACGAQPTMFAWGSLKSTPAIADIDGDGTLDVVIAGMHIYSPAGSGFGASKRAMIYAWTGFTSTLGSSPGSQPAYAAPWPMFHGRIDDRPVGSGGHVSDVCLTTPEVSLDRLHCRLDQLGAAIPCTLPGKVAASIARGRRLVNQAGPRRARRMLKRAARAFGKAQRLAAAQLADDCRPTADSRLGELATLAQALSAAASR
jgi:hypothetical protein